MPRTFWCSYPLHTHYLALNMHPQKLRVATALQTVAKAGIRCPAGPDAKLLSVAPRDDELLSQHNMGASELECLWQLQREKWRLEHLSDFSARRRGSYASK